MRRYCPATTDPETSEIDGSASERGARMSSVAVGSGAVTSPASGLVVIAAPQSSGLPVRGAPASDGQPLKTLTASYPIKLRSNAAALAFTLLRQDAG
jgi:hypothetical protein